MKTLEIKKGILFGANDTLVEKRLRNGKLVYVIFQDGKNLYGKEPVLTEGQFLKFKSKGLFTMKTSKPVVGTIHSWFVLK